MRTGRLMAWVALPLVLVAAPAAAAAAGAAAAAPGQQGNPWTAWLGCWRSVGEDGTLGGMVCVLPAADANAVRMVTVEDGAVVGDAQLHADGVARPVEDGGCTGTEQANWSADGRRVFVQTELNCNGLRRVSRGVIAVVAHDAWVDVQSLSVGDQHLARTIRYRAARPDEVPAVVAAELPQGRGLAIEAARLQAAAPLDFAGIVEASARVAPPAVEAVLAEAGHGFNLDGATLVALKQQGVPESTLDVMIALSHPERFAVRPTAERDREPTVWMPGRSSLARECLDPMYPEMRYRAECARYFGYSRYSRYGSMYYGYSPWGYDPYGWTFGRGPSVIIVRPGGEGREGASAVKGQGYTRGSNPSTGQARPRSGSQGGGQARERPPSTPSTTPSATGTSNTGSRDGGSRDTGRTARPRDGGSDD